MLDFDALDISSLKKYYESIPKVVQENLEYRIKLHTGLSKDKKAQEQYLLGCQLYPPIAFDTLFWTLNPQEKPGERNRPFILRPKQIEVVTELDWCIRNGHDFGIRKTRKEGATELVCKLLALHCILYPNSNFIVGSRKKELVDNIGDNYTIYAKIDHVFKHLMSWMNIKIDRKDMFLKVLNTNSTITGETTNENFSAGGRATAVFLDEFGRVDKSIAESIEGSVHDVANCIIYGSTHWLGTQHTFNKCLHKPTTKVKTLLWHENPVEAEGLYTSPEPGAIKLLDLEYYKEKHPFFELHTEFKLDDVPEGTCKFIADGCLTIPGDVRSPWLDHEEVKRRGNKRDYICNVWGEPIGAADMVFDEVTLNKIEIKPPLYEGEIKFDYKSTGSVDKSWFAPNLGAKRLKWWGKLVNGRPNQNHNYILGADISMGMGSSNSVISIYDVNTNEQVGTWTCPNTAPEIFADTTIALAYWLGGVNKPYLIWESNGPGGKVYADRIIWNGYYFVYTQRREDSKTRKKTNKYGWHSNTDAKAALLGELGVALSEGLREKRNYRSIIIYDEELLSELLDYIYFENSKETSTSSKSDLSSGARERHGDRVIAAALCVLATREQGKAILNQKRIAPKGSFQHRWETWKVEQENNKRRLRQFRFR